MPRDKEEREISSDREDMETASQSTDRILERINSMEGNLRKDIRDVTKRVDLLERRDKSRPPPSKKRATESPIEWEDRRHEDSESLPMPYWPPSDEEEEDEEGHGTIPTTTIKLSEDNAKIVSAAFQKALSLEERKRLRKGFPCPEIQETRCPRLDPIFKATSLQKEVKTGDAELARVQALMHDPVAPLIRLLHACDDVDTLISIDEAKEAVVESIQLLGNASVGLSRLRRKRLLKSVNPDIADLAEEEIFEEAAPNLFGSGFEKKMKERAESIKLLSASKSSRPTSSSRHQFFQRGRPTAPPRGGGQANRGRSWQKKPARK